MYLEQARTPGYPEHWSGPPEMVDRIASDLAIHPGQRVLDVGCGVGGPARRLADLGARVHGIDPVTDVVTEALRRSAIGPAVRYASASAEALPFADGSFDHVLCLGAIAHVRDRTAFAVEARRVLRPGGRVAITELFSEGGEAPAFLTSAPQPWQLVAPDVLRDELIRAGFEEPQKHPWPGDTAFSLDQVQDTHLRRDLVEHRLVPGMLVACKPI